MISTPKFKLPAKQTDAAIVIPPIRSMSIRRPLHQTNSTTLQAPDSRTLSEQTLLPGARRSSISPSETIKAAIDRLGVLSNDGQRINDRATNAPTQARVATVEDGGQRSQTRSSVSTRVAQYMDKVQAQSTQDTKSKAVASPKRVVLRDMLPYRNHLRAGKSFRACSPAHGMTNPAKSPPAEAIVSFDSPMTSNKKLQDGVQIEVPANRDATSGIAKRTEVNFQPISMSVSQLPKSEIDTAEDDAASQASLEGVVQDSKTEKRKPESSHNTVHFEDMPISSSIAHPPALQLNGEDFIGKTIEAPTKIMRSQTPRSQGTEFPSQSRINSLAPPSEVLRLPDYRYTRSINLKGVSFVDLPGQMDDLDNHENCHHGPAAREWSTVRKRITATIACMNASCIGLLLGIYAGEVPALQYVIIDVNHHIILGNVVLYLGIAISNFIFWPLPLLHGRKPYTIAGYIFGLCFQIPQGIAVGSVRFPDSPTWVSVLLISRALSGMALGLCDINVHATLLDLFGASLQSRHPHQEIPDPFDVRRQGGGLGLWLGIWSWCLIGPISVGFMIGAIIIDYIPAVWGFWLSLIVLMSALLLNVVAPEVRRAAFRRTLTEISDSTGTINRIARGEVKMHLFSTGPTWWGDEVKAGMQLSGMMGRQPGFLILSIYSAWVFAQFTLILVLLGALASVGYYLRPTHVGFCVLSLAIGAMLATPFQKASWLSRSRKRSPTTASMTMKQGPTWSSHLARRTAFTSLLPVCAAIYAATSTGPPFSIVVPSFMAASIGFFTAMALAECSGLIFESFDTSDLQPALNHARRRQSVVSKCGDNKVNFSSYPRIGAGMAVMQSIKYCFAAAATGIGGRVERRLGAVQAAAAVAGILLGMTALLTVILIRWKTVQLVADKPPLQSGSFDGRNIQDSMVMGRPSRAARKISILEAGKMTRWSEIRDLNKAGVTLIRGQVS